MKLEGTSAGFEAQLRSAGLSRFFGAAFLSVWLVFWSAGETIALGMLAVGAWSLLTGRPPEPGREPLRPELALPLGLFLLFWFAFWTFGGVMAGRELLRLLFGRDRIRVRNDTLEIEHSYGLFCSREKLPRVELRRFYRRPGSAALCVETARGSTELTRLGTAIDRAELAKALNAEFALAAQPAPDGALPESWCETFSLEGESVLVNNPVTRRKQAITMWIICTLVASVALQVISAAQHRPDLWGLAIFLAAIGASFTWGAVWLSFGRHEWKLEKGRLVLQRRFGANRTTRFEAVALELTEDSSGDDGITYQLAAVAPNPSPLPHSHRAGRHRRIIHSQTDDATEPRRFGLWLSQRCQVPFEDMTSTEAKAKQLEDLKQQLAASGRIGRLALRFIERLARPRTSGDE